MFPNRIFYVVHHSFPLSSDGYAVRTHKVAKALANSGFSVFVVNGPGWEMRLEGNQGANVPQKISIDGVTYLFMTSVAPCDGQQESDLEAAELAKLISVFKPAVVIAASNWRNALPAQQAARQTGRPFYYEVRGFWEVSRTAREPEWVNTEEYAHSYNMEAQVASSSDRVWTLNNAMKRELVSRGVPVETIGVIPNGCSSPEQPLSAERAELPAALSGCTYRVGYVGSFNEYEGLDLLIEACGLLRSRGVNIGLMLVGSLASRRGGEDKSANSGIADRFMALAKKCGMENHLYMPGRVEPSRLAEYYRALDLVVIPRKPLRVCHLVTPIKPMDAVAHGKPLLVSDVEALREWAENSGSARVFPAGDSEELAKEMHILLNDNQLRSTLCARGQQWLKDNDWDKLIAPLGAALTADATRVVNEVPPGSEQSVKNSLAVNQQLTDEVKKLIKEKSHLQEKCSALELSLQDRFRELAILTRQLMNRDSTN